MKVLRTLHTDPKNFLLPLLSISLLLVTVLVLYWQDLSVLVNEALQNEATNHIILVPFLVSFLIYQRREFSRASISLERLKRKSGGVSFGEITGIALLLSAFLLYWYGIYTTSVIELHVASLTLFVIGITLTLFNFKTLLTLIFPILFLLFLAPPTFDIVLEAGAKLMNFNAQASFTLLKTLGMPVELSSWLDSPAIVLNIPPQPSMFAITQACSGFYSFIAYAMFVAFLVLVVRGSIAKKIVLVPIGFLMLLFLNIIRISTIVLIAYQFGEAIAMTVFHTFSGWLLLSVGILILLLTAEKILHLKIYEPRSKAASCKACNDSPENNEMFCPNCGKLLKNHRAKPDKRFWVKIFGLLLATCVAAFCLQAPIFAYVQKLTLTNTATEASIGVFPEVSDYILNFLYRDTDFEKMSHTDASLTYAYFPKNVSNPTIFVLVGVGSSIGNLHNWEYCLVAGQAAEGMTPVDVFDERDVQIIENPPIMGRYFVFQYPPRYHYAAYANYTQVTLYWYQKALFKTGLTVEIKYTRISLLILTKNSNDYPKYEQMLLGLSQTITTYWEPLKAQSVISLGVPAMQILLVSMIVLAVVMQATQYGNEQRKKTTNLRLFENYGSPEEKRLYQTIKDLRQKTKETTSKNIESAFNHEPTNSTRSADLLGILENLRENGIIRLDVINVLNQPRLVWKP